MGAGLMISIVIAIVAGVFIYRSLKRGGKANIIPANIGALLAENVAFYNQLDNAGKTLFEARVRDFLGYVTVRGVDVAVEDMDRVLVASGAIIPIFAFADWRYNNIDEVLLYKGTFSKEYSTNEGERNVLGMVGDGALHREMLLSKPSLRASFRNPEDGHNTVIHEFAHLIDKADGEADGIPEYLLERQYTLPWVKLMRATIQEMKQQRHPDIDIYGATNQAEFFAVVSEYFFERPAMLKEHHPELYAMLEDMFHPAGKGK